jgi:hypothetical protein
LSSEGKADEELRKFREELMEDLRKCRQAYNEILELLRQAFKDLEDSTETE